MLENAAPAWVDLALADLRVRVLEPSAGFVRFCGEYVVGAAPAAGESPVVPEAGEAGEAPAADGPGEAPAAPDITVRVTAEDLAREREFFIKERTLEGLPPRELSALEYEKTATYRKIADVLPRFDACVFHGSCVAVDGLGYLFTAKSGTGKTTHSRLWLAHVPGSFVVNGDKPILRVFPGAAAAPGATPAATAPHVRVYGTPWAGKEGYQTVTSVPLTGLAILERGTENSIVPISATDAFPVLLQQSYYPPDQGMLISTIDILDQLGRLVPLYRLACNMDPQAAAVSYAAMSKPSNPSNPG